MHAQQAVLAYPARRAAASMRRCLTAALLVLVLVAASLGFAAPVDAQDVRQPYGATLTVEASGSNRGCESGQCDEVLTPYVAWLRGEGREIRRIALDSGTLRVQLGGGFYGSDFHQPFTLHLGSTALAFADATYSTTGDNDIFTWESTGLSWSAGDSVRVRITHPPLVAPPPFSPKADIEVGSGWQRFSLAQRGSKDWFTVTLENNKRYVIRIDTPQDSRRPRLASAYSPGGARQINEGGEHDCFRHGGRQFCVGKSWIDIDTYRGSRPGGSYRFYVDAPHSITGQPGTEPFSYSIRVEDRTSSSAPPGPLAAVFSGAPETHDGSTAFTMQLEFNATLTTGWEALRDSITVTNGTLTRIDRVSSLSHLWNLEITPTSESFITIAVAPSGVCDGANGICAGGRLLEEGIATKIYGTRAVTTVTNAEITNGPGENGTWDVGETVHAEVTFSSGVTIGGTPTIGITLDGARRDAAYTAYIGATGARFSYPITAADAGATQARLVANSLDVTNGLIGDNGGGDVILGFAGDSAVAEDAVDSTNMLSIADAEVTEGAGASLAFVVTLGPAAAETVTVDYVTSDGTATQDDDYTATSGTLTFEAGETEKTVTVAVLDDSADEISETVTVTLSNASGASIEDGEATGMLADNDGPAPLTATFTDAPATHAGSGTISLRLSLDAALSTSWKGVRHLLAVTNGTLTRVHRINGGSDLWGITVAPAGNNDVTVRLNPSADCADPEKTMCSSGGQRLEAAVSTVILGPAPAAPGVALTASFVNMPSKHDGDGSFTFLVLFSEPISISYKTMRDSSVRVTQGDRTGGAAGARRVDGRSDLWEITVYPASGADIAIGLGPTGTCTDTGAVCTSGGKALSSGLQASVIGPPGLSVADARVREAANATVDFAVTLSRAGIRTVTVDYATSDGTAISGADYTAASGTLTFAAGELSKTVSVTVLEDNHDDSGETFALTLSNPTGGAYLLDDEATGTIENTDPMPRAWLARFGRTVAEHVLEGVKERLSAFREAGKSGTLAGHGFIRDGEDKTPVTAGNDSVDRDGSWTLSEWTGGEAEDKYRFASLTLADSRFSLASGSEGESGFGSFWGRGAHSRFDGRDGDLSLDGEVTTATLGADWVVGGLTAGLSLSRSTGDGSYRVEGREGRMESSVTGLYPYLGYDLTQRLSVWGVAGYGQGELKLRLPGEAGNISTDTDMKMAAGGVRGELASSGNGAALAVEADALFARMGSDAVAGLSASEADVSRLRLGLEGSYVHVLGSGTEFRPSVEVGVRRDGGDAETGFGVDVGGGFGFTDSELGLRGEVSARGLVAHDAEGFHEWGVSGFLTWDPTPSSPKGLSLSLRRTLGASSTGGADALLGGETLTIVDGFKAVGSLEAEAGYGLGAFGGRGVFTPYVGLASSDSMREWRSGARVRLGALEGVLTGGLREGAYGERDARVRFEIRLPLGVAVSHNSPKEAPAVSGGESAGLGADGRD